MLSEAANFEDVLSKHNMKPWFETVCGYLNGALLAISLLMFYQTDNSILCTPSTYSAEYTTVVADIVNELCKENTSLFYIIDFDAWNLMFSVALYILSNWWLAVPYVTKLCPIINELQNELNDAAEVKAIAYLTQPGSAQELKKQMTLQQKLTKLIKLKKSQKCFSLTKM